jgi:hypothetical protein
MLYNHKQSIIDYSNRPASLVSSLDCFRNGTSVVPPVPVNSSPFFFDELLARFCGPSFLPLLAGRMIYRVTIWMCLFLNTVSASVAAVNAA